MRLSPWAKLRRPDKSGLTYALNFSYGTLDDSATEATQVFQPRRARVVEDRQRLVVSFWG
jgi:hypothetical protein